MRVGFLSIQNFSSYKSLDLDLSDMGLTLVYGSTGAGKSTVPDAVCWCLYGQTARGGAVDEVRSWTADGEATKGILTVYTATGEITVTRIRGKAKDNDLYWTEAETPDKIERGKDVTDTQRKLAGHLGVDADAYVSGSYFHEFSPSGSFFTATAKARREIFEKIAVLDLPAKLAAASSEARKNAKEEIVSAQSKADKATGRLESLCSSRSATVASIEAWAKTSVEHIKTLRVARDSFEATKAKEVKRLQDAFDKHEIGVQDEIERSMLRLQELEGRLVSVSHINDLIGSVKEELKSQKTKTCPSCGGPEDPKHAESLNNHLHTLQRDKSDAEALDKEFDNLAKAIKTTQDSPNPYRLVLEKHMAAENTYDARIKEAQEKKNPFEAQLAQNDGEIKTLAAELISAEKVLADLAHRHASLTRLYDISADLRGELLKRTVKNIEAETNRYLEAYFDAEIRVQFDIEGSDDLEVKIQKSGYECVYRQLSKGQRSLLRLCFCVAIMEASANKSGVHHDNLFFDEALDGLDSELKVKAFSLFEELATNHGSVLLIDHAPEFQALFSKRYHVEMVDDSSEITLEE